MFADSIEPANKETNMIRTEGESVTMSCSYDTSSNYVYLYWYRQYPNRQPLYLLRKGARSYNRYEHIPDHRFQSTTSQSSTELTIKSVTLSNSVHYYCALRVHPSQSFRSVTPSDTKCLRSFTKTHTLLLLWTTAIKSESNHRNIFCKPLKL